MLPALSRSARARPCRPRPGSDACAAALVAGDAGSCLLGHGCTYVAPLAGHCPGDQKKAAMRARVAAARNAVVGRIAAERAAQWRR